MERAWQTVLERYGQTVELGDRMVYRWGLFAER